jgi:hypothetical protein
MVVPPSISFGLVRLTPKSSGSTYLLLVLILFFDAEDVSSYPSKNEEWWLHLYFGTNTHTF